MPGQAVSNELKNNNDLFMKKIVFFKLLILSVTSQVAAQEYAIHQTCEASLIFLNHNKNRDEKLPGTVITLSNYSHQLEIRTVLFSMTAYSERSNFSQFEPPVSLDLKMIVSPNNMQRYLTSGKVFTANGILQLNNISKPVTLQYTPYPEGTEDKGQMLISLIVTFNLSDFFPGEFPDESIAFVVNNSFVNRL